MNLKHKIDERFINFYKWRLHQVFFYITDRCQLRCKQCLMKPNLEFQIWRPEIPLEEAVNLLNDFKELWASKLTLLWWEPTLYGDKLFDLIQESKNLWYEYIRIDTNWQFDPKILENKYFKKLDEISFSLDWYNEELHEYCRWKWTFLKTISNIKKAIALNYKVDITICIHNKLAQKDENWNYSNIENSIKMVEELWIKELNFHVLLKHNMPINTWSRGTEINYQDWLDIYKTIQENIENKKYNIELRLPLHFITKEEFEKDPAYYWYCATKLWERVLVTADWQIRSCAGLLASKYAIANYYDDKIIWQEWLNNETNWIKFDCHSQCAYQFKNNSSWKYVPLCFSFKPNQKEFVWNNKLNLK